MLALLLVCAVAWLAVTRLPAQAQFERWLRAQPGVLTVRMDSSRALGNGVQAASVPTPTATARMAGPLTVTLVRDFMLAFEGYAADHDKAAYWTVQLEHDEDVVTAQGAHLPNAEVLSVLAAVRSVPGLHSTEISITPWPPHLTATMTSGSDLVAAASTMAGARPETPRDGVDPWRAVPVTATDGPHTVTAGRGATVGAGVDTAFREAVRLEGGRRVTLAMDREVDGRDRSRLTLDEASPTAGQTMTTLSTLGFGLANHGEAIIVGDTGTPTFDTDAWSRAAGARLRALPGVLAVTLDPGDEQSPPSVDIRVTPSLSLARVATALPPSIDHVTVHTAAAAPDYDRDDALPIDPETRCPAGVAGTLNLAYTGPPAALAAAADYLADLFRKATPQCLHWFEPSEGSRADASVVDVRIPLRDQDWEPVLDVVLERRLDAGSAHPGLGLILAAPGRPWSALLIVRADEVEPTPGNLDAETPTDIRAALTSIQPVLDYWRSNLRTG